MGLGMVFGMIVIVVSSLAMTVAGIMTLVLAFRQSLGWGLLVLFVPFANLYFLFRFWPQTKRAVQVTLVGLGGLLLGIVVLMTSAAITGMRQGAAQRAAAAAVRPTPEAAWPPVVAQPVATPTPLPELPIDAPEPTPMPTPVRPLSLAQADDYLGLMVELVERDGTTSRVILHEVTATQVRVAEPYGGGGITYSIPREKVVGFRPLRARSSAR